MGALGPSQLSYSLNQWMIGIFKLGKISKIIESNHKPNIAKSTTEPGPYQGAHFRSLIRSIPLWTDNWKKGGGKRDKQVWFIAAISYLLFGCRMAFGKDPHPSVTAGETQQQIYVKHQLFEQATSEMNPRFWSEDLCPSIGIFFRLKGCPWGMALNNITGHGEHFKDI